MPSNAKNPVAKKSKARRSAKMEGSMPRLSSSKTSSIVWMSVGNDCITTVNILLCSGYTLFQQVDLLSCSVCSQRLMIGWSGSEGTIMLLVAYHALKFPCNNLNFKWWIQRLGLIPPWIPILKSTLLANVQWDPKGMSFVKLIPKGAE